MSDNQPSGSSNPFTKRDSHDPHTLLGYKFLTVLSWLLVVIISITHTFHAPNDRRQNRHDHDHRHDDDYTHSHSRTIWGQNSANQTPFKLNSILASVYWILLYLAQILYLQQLFSSTAENVTAAANVGSHFIINNLFTFAFVMLWTRGFFWWAELILVLNFLNLSALYFRHSKTPRFVHMGAVAGPLAWTIIALLWCGAAMVHAHGLAARIVANVAIWGLLFVGIGFLAFYRDYIMGFKLSFLTAALALGQMTTKVFALQWIFAWVIAGVLLTLSLIIAVPGIFGERAQSQLDEALGASRDREREPLLNDP